MHERKIRRSAEIHVWSFLDFFIKKQCILFPKHVRASRAHQPENVGAPPPNLGH